ncbi:MAG TPA: hypothetical protein DHW63_01635 [Hyphomonadaceae bacterium]|nr:hypothetical protein [Hyphomonadaceae bacterium]
MNSRLHPYQRCDRNT